MFRRCLLRRSSDFRTVKISDASSHVISKKALTYDHVAIDCGQFAGAALRVTRDLIGPEKDQDVIRHVCKTVVTQIMRRIAATKTLALLLDGTDPLWKIRRNRKYPGKRQESKFYRSAASPVMFTLEDKLRAVVFESKDTPKEVILSGPGVPGPVEGKMSQYLLDLAARDDVKRTDSVCLVGGTDLYINTIAMTPFQNMCNVTMNMGELKSLSLVDSMEFHGLGEAFKGDDNIRASKVRTDLAFICLLGHGLRTTDLPTLTNFVFKEALEHYIGKLLPQNKFLFDEQGDELRLHLANVEELISFTYRKPYTAKANDVIAKDYLEIALQSHAMLCSGGIRDYSVTTHEPLHAKAVSHCKIDQLLGHIKHLNATSPSKRIAASKNSEFLLTPAESLLVCSPTGDHIDQVLPAFSGGHTLPPGIAQSLVDLDEPEPCAARAREILSLVTAAAAAAGAAGAAAAPPQHRALKFNPSHYWFKKPGEKGPPPGWAHTSIVLGKKGNDALIRSVRNAEESTGIVHGPSTRNNLVEYREKDKSWEAIAAPAVLAQMQQKYPGGILPSYPKKLKLITWNVQFNKYSKQTTPLGKPGIDWCTPTRYQALGKILGEEMADVVAMQETEPEWWDYLAAQPWVQQNYRFTSVRKGEAILPWGLLMLVHKRLPVSNLSTTNVPGFSGHTSVMPTVHVPLGQQANRTLTISSVHLLAPYTQGNINVRDTQLETLTKRLAPKFVGSHNVIMGDFNDYPANFYRFPESMRYQDTWENVHGKASDPQKAEEGYTINGRRSAYTNLIIEAEFFGRADRVLYNTGMLQPQGAKLLGVRSVRQELQVATCPEYLFPSDHFGVCCEFAVV